jgi:biotin carboxylase
VGPDTAWEDLVRFQNDPLHPLSRIAQIRQVPSPSIDEVLPAVIELSGVTPVAGVISCGEVFVEPAGLLAEALGLPGPGTFAATVCRNKALQRIVLADWSPHSFLVHQDERLTVRLNAFPVVVKPTRRMYSSGVVRVDDQAALTNALAGYPPDEMLLVEDLVEGPEFSVETITHDGECVWAGVTAKQTNEATTPYFTETTHTSPAQGLSEDHASGLVNAAVAINDRLRVRHAIGHVEFRWSEGRPMLMEAAVRVPGDAITVLWHLATGRSLEPAIVDLALGQRPEYPQPARRARQAYLDHSPTAPLDPYVPDMPVTWIAESGCWPRPEPVAPDAPARRVVAMTTRRRGVMLAEAADSSGRALSVVVDAPLEVLLESVSQEWIDQIKV